MTKKARRPAARLIAQCVNNAGVEGSLTLGAHYPVASLEHSNGHTYYTVHTDMGDRATFNADRFQVSKVQ
jgi:hypothetical protein